jgi:DNA-binding XRE family transcriptional regulator
MSNTVSRAALITSDKTGGASIYFPAGSHPLLSGRTVYVPKHPFAPAAAAQPGATLGDRIRSERERLGLSQSAFGALAGVKRRAQANYETGERTPDATYLVNAAAAGVDVMFVLFGQRASS